MRKTVILVSVIVVAGIGIFGALAWFGLSECTVRPEERGLLVTIGDLRPFIPNLSATGGVFTAKRNIDGSRELEYEFNGERILIDSEAEIFPSENRAREGFRHRVMAYKLGMKISTAKAEVVEAEGLLDIGNDNFAGFFECDGHRLGNVVVARRGKTVLGLLLGGFYLDNKDDLTALLQPKLDKVGKALSQ